MELLLPLLPPFRTFLALVLLWIWLVGTHSAEVEEAIDFEDKENYLYYGDAEATAYVNDYHPDKEGAQSPTLYTPPFLFGPNTPPRVVEFYAPWCPHCQHFRDHYVQFAKQVRILGEENGVRIDVHAVSCQAFRPLCQTFGVHGYPRLLIFKAGEHNFSASLNYWDIHPFDVLRELDVQVDQLPLSIQEQDPQKEVPKHNTKAGGTTKQHPSSSSASLYPRSKQNVFDDARLSLFFALQNGIFAQSNAALTNQTRDALYDWFELLHYSLPPTWNVQQMVTAVLENYPNITYSEDALLRVVKQYTPSSDASGTTKKPTWSPSCSKGNIHMGYTCGLWQLLHMITVGVVEWNLMIQSDDGSRIVDTASAALTIRNFVEHFFGCDVCRINFVSAYDSCFLNRCHRLVTDATLESWIQLPVWLWEMHNAVNVRLLKEKFEREHKGRIPTLEEEHAVQWPSRTHCPRCWNDEGGWDDLVIYKFLRVEYWYINSLPEDFVTKEYRSLLVASSESTDDETNAASLPSMGVQMFLGAVFLGVLAAGYVKQRNLQRTGLHKKHDDQHRTTRSSSSTRMYREIV